MSSSIRPRAMGMLKGRLILTVLPLVAMSLLPACTDHSKDAPRETLAEYVGISMHVAGTGDKAKLAALTTGQAKQTIEAMDDAAFKTNFIDAHKEFLSLKIKDERSLTDSRFSITYELAYKSKTPNSDDLVTIKKHALLTREGTDGRWLISEVQNLKTDIEHQNAVAF